MKDHDRVLWALIVLAEGMEGAKRDLSGGIEITLNVGGVLVSGRIISHKLYISLLLDGALTDAIEKAKASGKLSPTDELDQSSANYIHLASAKFLLGAHNPIPMNDGVLWRGRLSSIDGFHMGILSPG